MTTFHIITIFPDILDSYLNESILKRAQKNKLIKIKVYDLRKFSKDKHKKVDAKPYGGGPGMVFKIEPIVRAIDSILKIKNQKSKIKDKTKIVLFSPVGKQFNQKLARDFSKKYKDIILIAGRYEGIDARVKKIFKAEEVSVGPYVLTGGELPAMVLIDSISRQVKGVLGSDKSLEDERGLGIPVYTRPEIVKFKDKNYKVPKILLSGNHKKIEEWRKKYTV
ncbi:MAG: tRNA (guanosine(37)-N1)-methyltransferase TrmD [Parcubacteria group bacterium]|nr:tRNA (guanosine(37)-N1)-methyltransferase TrmD [Parcubacteria group bacterium]MCR4343000.1 tRNA (guanosine(37)-N1)-methyltransferase TrmD [Patescibacteria group bacterium]